MKDTRGFTLIEIVVTIAITGILAGVFVNFFSLGAETFSLVANSQEVNQNKRIVLERMGREIRQAGSLTITSTTDIVFSADIDETGIDEAIRYFLSGTDLHRTVDGAGDTIMLNNVDTITFSGNGNRVVIFLEISSGGVTSSIQTSFLRRRSLS
jgi:prepilin-type N-terminal cleavage/methylation domain-containing protein